LFIDGTALVSSIEPEDLSHVGCRALFEATLELAKQGRRVSPEAVMATLEGRSDESALLGLMGECWSSGPNDTPEWERQILAASNQRIMREEMAAASSRIDSGESPEDVIAEINQRATERIGRTRGAEFIDGERLIVKAIHRMTEAREAREKGLPSSSYIPLGIPGIDKLVGGAPVGTPTILAARPGVGKTTFLLNALVNMAKAGREVLYLSNEDTDTPLGTAVLASESDVNRWHIFQGEVDDRTAMQIEQKAYAAIKVTAWAKRFRVMYVHGLRMGQVVARCRAIIRRHNVDAVGLDYIQNVPSPDASMPRHYGIEENLAQFETLLAQERIAGLMGCQLRRAGDSGEHEPTMRDLKDSGSLEQKAKLILALHDNDQMRAKNTVRAIILKNSQGITGAETIRFCRSTAKF